MSDDDRTGYRAPPRWLRGWRLLVSLAIGAVLLVGLTLITIVLCSGDLRPVIARAKRDGLPTTWKELGLHADPSQALTLQQIKALVAATKSYGYASVRFAGKSYALGTPGTPLDEGFIRQIRSHAGTTHERIRSLVAVSQTPFIPCDDPDVLRWVELYPLVQMHMLATEEFLGSPAPNPQDALALLGCCRSFGPYSYFHLRFRLAALQRAAKAMRFHLDALRSDPASLAAELRAAAAALDPLHQIAARANFAFTILMVQADPMFLARNLGMALPGLLEKPICMSLFHRLGRVEFLDEERRWTLAVAACSDPTGPKPPIHQRSLMHAPIVLLEELFYFDQNHALWWREYPRCRMALLATAAALDDSPWPIDPYSPTTAPLKPLCDGDGTVLAVASAGPNGVDEGGNGDDYVIELRAPKEVAIKAALTASSP